MLFYCLQQHSTAFNRLSCGGTCLTELAAQTSTNRAHHSSIGSEAATGRDTAPAHWFCPPNRQGRWLYRRAAFRQHRIEPHQEESCANSLGRNDAALPLAGPHQSITTTKIDPAYVYGNHVPRKLSKKKIVKFFRYCNFLYSVYASCGKFMVFADARSHYAELLMIVGFTR